MSANFKVMSDDNQFLMEMNRVPSNRLVAVDFTSARCPPCVQIAPLFHGLASKYKNALFLKVDIHNCPMAAQSQAITATPTFILFRNKVKIDSIRGADIEALEAKIRNHYGDGTNSMEDNDECGVPGHMDLVTMIYKAGSECLNESDDNTFGHALSPSAAYLESDADEQLILYIAFNQAVKVHSLRIKGPEDNGPKNVKLFINQPYTLDFDAAETATPIQELDHHPHCNLMYSSGHYSGEIFDPNKGCYRVEYFAGIVPGTVPLQTATPRTWVRAVRPHPYTGVRAVEPRPVRWGESSEATPPDFEASQNPGAKAVAKVSPVTGHNEHKSSADNKDLCEAQKENQQCV